MFADFVVIVIWILTHRSGREPNLRKKPLPGYILTGVIFILVQGGNFAWRKGAKRTGFSNIRQKFYLAIKLK